MFFAQHHEFFTSLPDNFFAKKSSGWYSVGAKILMLCWWCSRRNYWESLATYAKLTLNLNIKIWIFIPCAVLKMIKQKPWNHAVSRLLVWQGQKDLNPRHAVLETAALPTELYPYIMRFNSGGPAGTRTPDRPVMSRML